MRKLLLFRCVLIGAAIGLVSGFAMAADTATPGAIASDQPPVLAKFPVLVKPGDHIVTFGDSISSGKGYGYMAVEMMNQERPDLKLTWSDQGYPGWKASDAVTVVNRVIDEKPTLVTIMFGTNDLGQKGAMGIATLGAYMRELAEPLVKAGIRVVLLTTPYANPKNVLGAEWDRAGIPTMGEEVWDLGKKMHLPVFDMYAVMKKADEEGKAKDPAFDMFNGDGVHPDPEGHKLMARALADFLLGKSKPAHQPFHWVHPTTPVAVASRQPTPINLLAATPTFPLSATPMILDNASQIADVKQWKGPQDLSAVGHASWDKENLYIQVNVTDDVVIPGPTQPAWDFDGIEFFFDVRPFDKRTVAWSPGYYQILAQAMPQNGVAAVTMGAFPGMDLENVNATYQRTPEGYIINLQVPWARLGFTPKSGSNIGFDFAINDRNDWRRGRYKALWRGAGDDFTNAGSLGTLKLE